jgi:hypothetical protein
MKRMIVVRLIIPANRNRAARQLINRGTAFSLELRVESRERFTVALRAAEDRVAETRRGKRERET